MFSYGEGNQIDFDKMNDVCGLFAANTSGKSSLLDAITYTIFDKCSKTSKANEVLNNKKTTFKGVFKFKMNDVLYTIERVGTKKKDKHVKVDVNFYTETENLNGEERSDTNKSIRRYLGTYNDFILTAFSLQADNNNFIEKSQRERKDLLSQFLDITVFEQLYQLANDEIKETAGKLREYKKTDFADIINTADDVINTNKDFIIEKESTESSLNVKRNDYHNEILTLIESKQATTYDGPGIDSLTSQETQLTEKIEELQQDIETIENELVEYSNSAEQLKSSINNYDKIKIESGLKKYNQYITQQQGLDDQLKDQEGIINGKAEKIKHLETHEYDPECKYCTSNVFVQDATKAKNTIDQDRLTLKKLKQQSKLIKELVDSNKIYQEESEQLKVLQSKLKTTTDSAERCELQLQILENDLQTKESELETNAERQELYFKNKSAIEINKTIDATIDSTKSLITDITSKLKTITNQIKSKHGEIEVAKTKKKQALEQLEKYKQLETEYKAFEYYLSSVKRDGIPYDLISKAIPKIEAEINNVLNQVVDFNMVLNTDGKNINGYIIYDEDNFWPLELTSGMERFISSLAIRIALNNVSALPRPNFIAIDEGWGSLDAEHISAVVNLFEYFRTKFDFSIIISHVDTMRDMVDNLIEVNKTQGYSQISHI
jgi:DNA repair exonuclease SbcCD ATPase subunit